MTRIETKTTLEKFRRFLISNSCASFIPKEYMEDPTIFPERDPSEGAIYVEAVSKVPVDQIRNVRFVKVADVLGVLYSSKSGNTNLKWRQTKGNVGKLTGYASPNSIVNLLQTGILTPSQIKQMLSTLRSYQQGSEREEA
ncbi:MAG: hypothetical protein B9J98_02105 [Candidatus Terraquivivens tikiterensis]|uniref:Uncharacterized protein n=1 Tax=Candidatus Terraquivivens tikiterensis TaxID=1980982 RepID=A0A2R7Y894_9ARCH|nr:MAG: hypothetical protein B9J98_02105 [Candidatus Terraquivivens tikiterensis]